MVDKFFVKSAQSDISEGKNSSYSNSSVALELTDLSALNLTQNYICI